jgi:hypothetical protein
MRAISRMMASVVKVASGRNPASPANPLAAPEAITAARVTAARCGGDRSSPRIATL